MSEDIIIYFYGSLLLLLLLFLISTYYEPRDYPKLSIPCYVNSNMSVFFASRVSLFFLVRMARGPGLLVTRPVFLFIV